MRIAVFGASGQTGAPVVRALLAAGHTVTVLARQPSKLTEFGNTISVVAGDGRDANAVARTVVDQDAVISTFGPRSLKHDDLQQVFTANLVAAMQQYGVKRLIDLSAWGAGDSIRYSNLAFKLFQKTILRNIYIDKNEAERLILTSDLEYSLVRPGQLKNSPAKGGVRASLTGAIDGKKLSLAISRADVASFMIAQLSDPIWIRQAPLIGY